MKLNELIVEYRESHKISQRQFAKQCGFTNTYLHMIETGTNPTTGKKVIPSINTLFKISKAMGMTLQELSDTIEDSPVFLGEDMLDLSNAEKELINVFRKIPEDKQADCIDFVRSALKMSGLL